MKTEATAVRLTDYRPPAFAIDTVDVDLIGDELAFLEVRLDGRPLSTARYTATPSGLTVKDVPGAPFELTIVTELNPSANTKLMGLYRSSKTFCTQCEAEGFRRITYFLDRPDVLSVYTTRIDADKALAPILLSNGNLIDSGDIGGGRHFAVWHDPFPKP